MQADTCGVIGTTRLARKNHEYLGRSEQRERHLDTPQKSSGTRPPRKTQPGRKKRSSPPPRRKKSPLASVGYAFLTMLLLVVLFPVGLFLLWAPRLRWRVTTKLILMVLTGVAFVLLISFALNFDTGNTTISNLQADARDGLSWLGEQLDQGFNDSVEWMAEQGEAGLEAVKGALTVGRHHLQEGVVVSLNWISGQWDGLPRLYHDITPERLEASVALIEARKQAEVDETLQLPTAPSGRPTTARVSPAPSPKGSATPTPTPTVTPTPTPTATPTPTPVVLPSIKKASLATVYFTAGGSRYHTIPNCDGMMNALTKTLYDAEVSGKLCCEMCDASPISMLDAEYFLWCDSDNVVHTTDMCAAFHGQYRLLPFEDAYTEKCTFCTTCQANLCHAYIEEHASDFGVFVQETSVEMQALYALEKTITVYYTASSRHYHENVECAYLPPDSAHTLYDALHIAHLTACTLCKPITENALLENRH